jgi:long-chain acyl-CoA synthetase
MPYRQGPQPLHEYLRHHARTQGDKPAFIWYGLAISYAQLDDWSDAVAAQLQALGVARGHRVALFMNNCPQYVVAHVAVQKCGAIVGPCGPLFKAMELEYQLNDLGAQVIVVADTLLPVLAEVQPRTAVRHLLVTRHGDLVPDQPLFDVPPDLRAAPLPRPDAALDFVTVMRSGARPQPVAVSLDDVSLLTYTSGTTGLPKGAMLSYGNALFKSSAAADCNGIGSDDVVLAVAPLYHIAGMLMGINVTLYTGATTVLMHRFDPLATVQAIQACRVSWWYSIAPMNVAIMALPQAKDFDLSSLKVNAATSFGITLTQTLAEQWRAFTGGAALFEAAYGLSETHTMDTYMPQQRIRWGTHGVPAPGVEIRIIDPHTGAPRAAGEQGEIVLRSAGNFQGYFNKPEATAATLRNGWVHTGDMGVIDEQGYLTFQGRFKEMIKVSGYSVFPEEVETLLIRHPAVAQAAVIGLPDDTKGEVVKAFIVCKPGAVVAADELIAWAREHLSAYKVPREVAFIDALPATGAGKVLRRLLKN